MFYKDVQRLNALKTRLQDKFPFNLSHPFLIMMLLDEWEKRNSLTVGATPQKNNAKYGSLATGQEEGV
jgi:hypothetical protein